LSENDAGNLGRRIVLAAFFRTKFENLPPVHRAWFDWLVGSNTAKRIRSGKFGL
jgi:hypothetical protein